VSDRASQDTLLSALQRHVAPLHRKVRSAVLERLAAELAGREPEADGPERLVSQVLRMKQLAEDKLALGARLEQAWQELTRRYYARTDEQGRRQALSDYLTETIEDPVARKADLAALDRHLDHDALRERHLIERHHLLVDVELAVTFISNAGAAALEGAAARGRERLVRELFDAGRVGQLLHQLVESPGRWQLRLAALTGLAGFAAGAKAHDPRWHQELRSAHLGLAVRCATNAEDHPFLQGAAMRLVLLLSEGLGLELIAKRLLDRASWPAPPSPAARRDFLVRRQCVELLAAGDDRALELLRRAHAHRDPSEHVRQGLAEAFASTGALGELAALAGLDPQAPEPSARVRATAVQAACRCATEATLPAVAQLVREVLERDADALPLAIACEDLPGTLARAAGPDGPPAPLARPVLAALLALASHPERPAAIQEAAAAAAERVDRAQSYEGRAWTHFFRTFTHQIEPGKARSIPLAQLAELPPLPADPTFLGRILAELSRDDYPLFATRRRGRIVVWRGDRYRRRLWRVLHELRARRPNKRQAHLHTVGRVMKGHLRAPPGGLDEVTATVVPGERVHVSEEGGWGRHLPTVDDVLDLPLLSRDPVHVFSSHGVTTIQPPPGLWARLRNRLALALRYEALASLRLQSLRGAEPHTRMRYAEQLRSAYGIRVTFARYDYDGHRPPAPSRLASLFAPLPLARGAT
jgi:hypothetical protein